ncbi:hypothetical protein GPY51_23595 [Photorhabdus laumondii subsp. laumondii]|uniref:Uncharacterized protein n=1 Tax=Photorhabdus laumondii subsp. laumondii TaxID=141679 RepID=A0A6L9JXF1_PHOLM|nr:MULTISPECIES: hypothetical protein [Photorhabdus]MCC8386356.1 hypothetical protein [Photorhabdus laumondii]MCC8388853.1 hypothetical protein [Photorhabdus laumondii]MCC8415406.1 hypothetical protein [Photorhabdus laumondii]NDK97295.1 hypothetical protein [Photorhabdus laumondii subsp. laumondii]NDL15618.1 hypothetical protein [Photorhabdus laumondii subsp. laumondii]
MGKSPASYPPAIALSDAQVNLNLFFYVNSPQEIALRDNIVSALTVM